jgi:hypothetical protein
MVMILFGLAEVLTGFTDQFFGLTITKINISTYLGVTLGLFCFVSGILLLTRKRWAAIIAIFLVCGGRQQTLAFFPSTRFPKGPRPPK